MPIDDKIKPEPIYSTWKDSGFDRNLQRSGQVVEQGQTIPGTEFNTTLSELLFNRMIKLKNLPASTPPQKADPGKIYWDQDNKKFKLYVDGVSQFVDILWTSTSTSTTSSSSTSSTSSSSSSLSTSSSTSSTSSSSSSTSTT